MFLPVGFTIHGPVVTPVRGICAKRKSMHAFRINPHVRYSDMHLGVVWTFDFFQDHFTTEGKYTHGDL